MRGWRWGLAVAVAAVYFLAPLLLLRGGAGGAAQPPVGATPRPGTAPAVQAAATPYRAVWVSYLEWQAVDFSTAAAFTAAARGICQSVAAAGGTVILAQLRPFCDALYPSSYFPFSHLCTGTQGADPGYDPLKILLDEAGAAGLEVEAWLNPYRVQAGGTPAVLSEDSPAVRHPDWVKRTESGLYLDPGNAAVRQYIAGGIAELCEGYDLAGIHLDDYFYPTDSEEFDAEAYQKSGTALCLADWRRQNVNALVAQCYAAAHRYGVRFGVSPMGEIELNYAGQYSDAALWLREPGYVDYLLPQLYRGLDYTKNGDTAKSFGALAAAWAALPRAAGVKLYAGLGAYHVGEGDGGDNPGEWQSGHALADQWAAAKALGFEGAGLYRYDSLWGAQRSTAADAELAALQKEESE